jgi:hypothetical protein
MIGSMRRPPARHPAQPVDVRGRAPLTGTRCPSFTVVSVSLSTRPTPGLLACDKSDQQDQQETSQTKHRETKPLRTQEPRRGQ